MAGEKHVRPDGVGGAADGDSSAYNGDNREPVRRSAGPGCELVGDPAAGPFPARFGGPHLGVCQFVLADGSVRPVRATTPGATLGRLAARADGHPVPEF